MRTCLSFVLLTACAFTVVTAASCGHRAGETGVYTNPYIADSATVGVEPGGPPFQASFNWVSLPVNLHPAIGYAVVVWDASSPADVSPPAYHGALVRHTYSTEGTYTVEVRWYRADGTFVRSFDVVVDLVAGMPLEIILVPFPDRGVYG